MDNLMKNMVTLSMEHRRRLSSFTIITASPDSLFIQAAVDTFYLTSDKLLPLANQMLHVLLPS